MSVAAGAWVLDDFTSTALARGTSTAWRCVTDRVMGGISQAQIRHEPVAGRPALVLRGSVSLDNNGGFVQMALDLAPGGAPVDARGYSGVALCLHGDGRDYNLHLRSADCHLPWQSYRASLPAAIGWSAIRLPFSAFSGHRIDAPLDLGRLRRIGLVAIGSPGPVEVALGRLSLYP